MSDPSTPSNADEQVLARLLLDREQHGDVIVLEYLDRYPHLAEMIRSLLRLGSVIERSRPADEVPLPARLEDFRIVGRAGSGGMGEVFEAVQERLQRRVAVKVIRRGQGSPEARARFWREGLAQALLHHTHILPIYLAGEQDGLPFLVMPFVEGASLHALVAAARDLPAAGPGSVPPLKDLAELAGRKPAAAVGKAAGSDEAPRDEPDRGPKLQTTAHGVTAPSPSPNTPRKGGASPRLSPAYFRSVAALLADAADAVQHAHEAQVVHRDLKPSNLLVDAGGQCWVIDFGLAGFLGGGPAPVMLAGGDAPSLEPLTVGQTLGTPGYMAPEQLRGLADARTDVWGLGVTLYELLTLRPAFTGLTRAEVDHKVRSEAPARPRSLVGNVPPDLEAVCLKALRKDPGERYPSARELRDDLRRWLAGEPTRARGAWPLRRAALWARRNKGWAAALAFGLLAVLTGAGAAVWLAETEKTAEKNRAGERTAAEHRQQERRRETYRLQLLNLRLMPHVAGWSDRAWRLVEEAASLPGEDDLRDQAAATLIGFDFDPRVPIRFPETFPASSVAFDAKGHRLLTGGLDGKPAHLWEGADAPPKASRQVGPGPVTFDGETPLQLIVDTEDPGRVLLWDVARQLEVRTFPLPGPARTANDPEAGTPLLYMTAGGELIAIATSAGIDKGQMAVWDARGGKHLGTFDGRATALAVSPDGSWLASGAENGQITLHSLATRKTEPLPHLGRTRIQCLAFHRDVHRTKGADGRTQNWLLASGDAGGTTVVWDVGTRIHRGVYRGSHHGVGAVAFSPDNMTLATGGLDDVRLWDLASGKVLLQLGGTSWSTGLTFSSDGGMLACVHQENLPVARPEARIWRLEVGRGVRSLRGLTGQVSKVALSGDGHNLAALSHDSRLGVWNLNSMRLLHILDVPPSMFTADNAALAFSADGDHLAFAAGKKALQWEVATAREEGAWDLPLGDCPRIGPGGPFGVS